MPAKSRATKWLLVGLLASLAGVACQTVAPPAKVFPPRAPAHPAIVTIGDHTLLPESFAASPEAQWPASLLLPQGTLVSQGEVNTDASELREGPGTQFSLKDQLLAVGTRVIITEALGAWRKVFSLPSPSSPTVLSGWMHHALVSPLPASLASRSLPVELKHLPVIVAIRPLANLYTYPDEKKTPVHIPKGSAFIALKKTRRKTLIWIAETNSLAWLANQDIR